MSTWHSFYIYFLSYNTLQNKLDHIAHNLLLDEAWAGDHQFHAKIPVSPLWNQWFFSRDYITKQWADWYFSMELLVFRLQSVPEIFGLPPQLGLEPATHTSEALTERYLNGSQRILAN